LLLDVLANSRSVTPDLRGLFSPRRLSLASSANETNITYTNITFTAMAQVTSDDRLTGDKVQEIINACCHIYEITDADERKNFKQGLWKYFCLNGCSNKSYMQAKILADGNEYDLQAVAPLFAAKARAFMRGQEHEVVPWFNSSEPGMLNFRLQVIKKYNNSNEIIPDGDAVQFLDFVKEEMPDRLRHKADIHRARRISRSRSQRAPQAQVVAVRNAPTITEEGNYDDY